MILGIFRVLAKEITLKESTHLKNCPTNCNLCIKACPTNSLFEPYMMNRSTCISCLTTWEGWDLPNEKYNRSMGNWIFGCDVCQDVCPFNKNKWSQENVFPNLEELGKLISLEQVIEMDYYFLREVISQKFWYLSEDDVWKWKTNALNTMLNNYNTGYDRYIDMACYDENENVRKMDFWVQEQI